VKLAALFTILYFSAVGSQLDFKNYAFAEGPVDSLRLELSLLSSQIEDLRTSLLSPEVRSLAPSDAGIAILRLDALEAKLRATVGRVEALEFHLQILSKDANNRIAEFNSRLIELELEKTELKNSSKELEVAEISKGIKNNLSSDEGLFFDKAFLTYNGGDFEGSTEKFGEFIELYPFSINIAEAQYWLAMSVFQLNEYKKSAKAFLEAFSLAPSGSFASVSLLGLGKSLGQLGQIEQACLTLKELKLRYGSDISNINNDILKTEERLQCP
jgi:TolA-binding protein